MALEARAVRPSWIIRLVIVTLLVGVGSGLSGLLVSLSLHGIEHLAYGYTSGTFLDGVLAAPAWKRVVALGIAGVVGAIGWWMLRRWGRPVVSVEQTVAGTRMPGLVTLINSALQVVIVGLGASIGREVAPRELGALVAGWVTDHAGLTARERRILVACGAGAGLAAVYNVPLGGALFTVEILLAELSFATALPAIATSAVTTIVARVAVPTTPLYSLPSLTLSPSVFVWAVIAGPVLGFAALGFVRGVRFALEHRPRGKWILLAMPVVFLIVGAISIFLPPILGNGRALGQVAFDGATPLLIIAALLVAKTLATTGTIYAGAAGGTLTPSLAIGATIGVLLGGLWSMAWPGSPIAAFAFIAAAAFLASTTKAPFTALVLVVEFTGQGPALLVPAMLAIGGAVAVTYLWGRGRLAGAA